MDTNTNKGAIMSFSTTQRGVAELIRRHRARYMQHGVIRPSLGQRDGRELICTARETLSASRFCPHPTALRLVRSEDPTHASALHVHRRLCTRPLPRSVSLGPACQVGDSVGMDCRRHCSQLDLVSVHWLSHGSVRARQTLCMT